MIHTDIQKSPQGGFYSIVDAGKLADIVNLMANGKRVPEFVLPDEDPITRDKMRPDILRIKGLPVDARDSDILRACRRKDEYVIQIIEVGYCSDTRWEAKLEKKKHQHTRLKAALEAANWKVEEYIILLGSTGVNYQPTLQTLCTLGMLKHQAMKVMRKLCAHGATIGASILLERHRLAHQDTNPATQTSIRRGIG